MRSSGRPGALGGLPVVQAPRAAYRIEMSSSELGLDTTTLTDKPFEYEYKAVLPRAGARMSLRMARHGQERVEVDEILRRPFDGQSKSSARHH